MSFNGCVVLLVGLVDGDGGERPVRLLDHEIPSSEFLSYSECVVGSSTMSRRCTGIQRPYSWCDPGNGTRAWNHRKRRLEQRAHVHQGLQPQLLYCTVDSIGTVFCWNQLATSAAHCGRHPASHVVVLGVLLQGEDGCCCHLKCLDSKRSINIH